jgi:hypothetical protein
MKKMILAVIIGITFPTLAVAQSSYSETNSRMAICRELGNSGVQAFELKRGMGEKPKAMGGYAAPIDQYAIDFGYNIANTKQDAYMAGWSYCMDNLDRLARAWGR